MKKYWSFFRMRFLGSLQYRAAAWAGIATQFAWGFMQLLMYRAFYEAGPAAFPMEFSQLATYIWLQQAFLLTSNVPPTQSLTASHSTGENTRVL